MSFTIEETVVFNDIEIMDVSDFNAEGDENYVSVELRSDDDEEDDGAVLLDPSEDFSPAKALLESDDGLEQNRIDSSITNQITIISQNHRFLADHEYLNGGGGRNNSTNVTNSSTIKVDHSSERFSVPYVEDLGMQDLFNKDNTAADGTGEEAYESCFKTKIEIEEPQIQEMIMDVGNELISYQLSDEEPDSQDECYNILQGLDNSVGRFSHEARTKSSPLENDHSYTTINIITPQPSDREDSSSDENDESKLKKLVTLSTKLAQERSVQTVGAQKTAERIERVMKSILKRSKPANVTGTTTTTASEEEEMQPPVQDNDTPDTLSVQLSANCSERLEADDIVVSSAGSIGTSNVARQHDDFSSDTDSSAEKKSADLEELILLGNKFSKHCEQWFEKAGKCEGTAQLAQLSNIFQKINRQCEQIPFANKDKPNVSASSTNKVEIAVQTERSKHSEHLHEEQRTLNEQYKKRLLDSSSSSSNNLSGSSSSSGSSSNSSSSSSDSEGSAKSRSSDSENENDIMKDFVTRNRRKRKSAKEKHKSSMESQKQHEGKRADQIYSDSSGSPDDEDAEKHSVRAEGDENLLDGVLSGVDDIMSDVHDIIPDAVGVVQDYLAGEEQRQERENANKTPATMKKTVREMTQSEREDYYEDMQIERLCNLSNLVNCRTAAPSISGGAKACEEEDDDVTTGITGTAPAKAKDGKELQKKKKTEHTMEDFLNDENSSSDSTVTMADRSPAGDGEEEKKSSESESEKDVVETEEQFLQKCNENMKRQLLNLLSSSETTSGDEDLRESEEEESNHVGRGKQNGSGNEDSNDSSASLVESFLKRHDSKLAQRKGGRKRLYENLENGDATAPPLTNGQSMDAKLTDGSVEREAEEVSSKVSPSETGRKSNKMELANPKDKELFSNDLFDEERSEKSKKTTRKKRRRVERRANRSSDSDRDTSSSSVDSDVELLDGLSKKQKRKRKRKPALTLETFNFSAALNASKTPRKTQPTPASVVSGIETAESTIDSSNTKQASATIGATTESTMTKASSPVTTAATTPQQAAAESSGSPKEKPSKDGQDCISLSSDSSDDAELIPPGEPDDAAKTPTEKEPKRKIRAMLTNDELAEETKRAQKEEESRAARLKKKQEQLKKFLATYRPGPGESDLVLDYDSQQKQPICVHPDIVKLLKPHQIEGIKFMYDNTYGSVDAMSKHSGSGCILAHCMGLGKTLQMISLLHTVMRYPQLRTNRVLVICPKSTVMNWKDEIIRWQGAIRTGHQMKVYCFADVCTQNEKLAVLKRWFGCRSPNCGVMLIGYEAFRALINYERRKGSAGSRSSKLEHIKEYLLNPGADLVICDEGHQIKNKRSAISEAVSKIKTRRRIMLTGTPIQNNLKEYYCMVNFIKPSFLGSDKEFSNLYANPIKNGQCKDSDQQAIKIMKQRSYVLHNKLSKFVQRKEAAVLKEFLPDKYEYVLFVPLTPVQEKMYEVFLQMNEYTTASSGDVPGEQGRTKKFKLIADYTSLRKIWTHPKVLEKAWEAANLEKNRKDAARKTATPDSDDDSPDDHNDIASGQLSVTNDWWRQFLETADLESLYPSNKLWILFEILKQSKERGEKVLIFSGFVSVLNAVEHFMAKIHHQDKDPQQSEAYAYTAFKGPWEPGQDYYRLDGKTPKSIRHAMITSFNDPANTRTKCFLISAKAGGQGINLTGANRVIILDTSWNPSNDQQNIFRIFRLGQKRECYVYRLIAAGTMEEKVYSRSVTKQALSFRVVDEQQIDRHYSYGELAELYTLTKVSEMTRETPILPADDVLASLLRTFPNKIFKYHVHDSLLENKPEQDLSEEEKREAWAAYEREIQNNENRSYLSQFGSMGAAAAPGGLFGPAGGYSASMASYYASLGYGGMAGLATGSMGGGDMYRNDYSSYGSSLGRQLYMPYGAQQQYSSLLNDPTYAAMLAKVYGSYSMAAGSGSGMDAFGMGSLPTFPNPSPMSNGQSLLPSVGPGSSQLSGSAAVAAAAAAAAAAAVTSGKGYPSTTAIANMLSYYSGKPTSGGGGVGGGNGNGSGSGTGTGTLPPPALAALNQSSLANSSNASLAEIAAQRSAAAAAVNSGYNPLKQMTDYTQGSSPLLPPPPAGMPPSSVASGLTISNISSFQKPNQSGLGGKSSVGGSTGNSSSIVQGVSSLFSRLSEQLAAASSSSLTPSAGASSPFAPRNVPLLSPTLDTSPTRSSVSSGTLSLQSSTASVSIAGSSVTGTTLPTVSNGAAAAISLAIGQGVGKKNANSMELASVASYRLTSNSSSSSTARIPVTTPVTVSMGPNGGVIATTTTTTTTAAATTPTPAMTLIPSDDDDDLTNRLTLPPSNAPKKPETNQRPGNNKRASGNNVGIAALNAQQNTATTKQQVTTTISSSMKDMLKTAKSLTSLTQQPAKPMSPKVTVTKAAVQTSQTPPPPIISNPTPAARFQMTRTNSSSSLSGGTIATNTLMQQALAKTAAKTRQPSPTFKQTPVTKQQPTTANSRPSALQTVQTVLPAAKTSANPAGTIPSPRFVVSSKAASSPISTAVAKGGAKPAATANRAQPMTGGTVVNAPIIHKTVPKTSVMVSASQPQGLNASATKQSAANSLVTALMKHSPVSIPKTTAEPRPMSMTIVPVQTPGGAGAGGGGGEGTVVSKTIKKPLVQKTPVQMAKITQVQSAPSVVTSHVGTNRTVGTVSSNVRPMGTLQKSASSMKITPVTLLSTASMTGKISGTMPGTAASVNRQPAPATIQSSVAKTTQPVSHPQVMVAKPTPAMIFPNRTIPMTNRVGKSTVTVASGGATKSPAAGLGSHSITKASPANVSTVTGRGVQQLVAAAAPAASSAATSTMTVIPSANIISPTVTGVSSAGVTSTTAKQTISYSYKDVGRNDYVIRKAVASPTMRRILPTSQGGQQILINKTAPGTAGTVKAGSPTVVKSNVPIGNIIRVGTNSTITSATPAAAGVQPTANSMFIRRRGVDSATLDSLKAKNAMYELQRKGGNVASSTVTIAGTPPAKRPRIEDMVAVSNNSTKTNATSSPAGTSFVVTNRLGGSATVTTKNLPVKTATAAKKDDPSDVVVLE